MESLLAVVFVLALIALALNARYEDKKSREKAEYHKELNKKIKIMNEKKEEKKKAFEGQEVEMADKYEKYVLEMVEKHKFALLADRKKLVTKDSYGVSQDKGWNESKENKTGIDYFEINVLFPFIDKKFEDISFPSEVYFNKTETERFYDAHDWAIYCFCKHKLGYHEGLADGRAEKWRKELINHKCDEIDNQDDLDFQNTDSMSGIEYEQYCKNILKEVGWEVEDTPISGDQGVDLIASIEDVRVCIQCKCFAKAVGNKAVQEVAAGIVHWKGTHAVVVARNGFTKSARTLAESNKVILTSDSELENLENLVL